jgi:hypothetical protein
MVKKIPTNISLTPDVARRLRVVAAHLGKRQSELAEEMIVNALPAFEAEIAKKEKI